MNCTKLPTYVHVDTPQRVAILRVLLQADEHLTPTEIVRRVQSTQPGITEPTVYRTLNFLASQGLILRTLAQGNVVYELAEPHHHLVCRQCGATVDIAQEMFAPLYAHPRDITGYQVDGTHLVFTGLCSKCFAESQ